MTAKFDLKCTRDDVKDYQKKLRLEIDKNKELAKKLVRAKKKDRALLLLKMNRFKQKRVDDLDNQLLNLEEMLLNIESSEQQQKVVQGIKAGNMAKVSPIAPVAQSSSVVYGSWESHLRINQSKFQKIINLAIHKLINPMDMCARVVLCSVA